MPEIDHAGPPKKKSRIRTLLISAATILATSGLGVAGAQAFTAAEIQHFAECFGWMLTDPGVHAQNCLPGHMPAPGSLIEPGPPIAPEPTYSYTYSYT